MRKILFSMLAVAGLLATSCQKTDLAAEMGDGSSKDVTISVAMDGVSGTRAIDAYGTGDEINRCILEVYNVQGDEYTLYKRMVGQVKDKAASFDLRLVTSQDYQFVAWADCVTDNSETGIETDLYYNTDSDKGLRDVEILSSAEVVDNKYDIDVNNDKRDAFFGTQLETVGADAKGVSMTLKRPLGQLNITTLLTDVAKDLYPETVERVMTNTNAYKRLDALTGDLVTIDADDATTYFVASEAYKVAAEAANNEMHLSTEYYFAPEGEQHLINVELTFNNTAKGEITSRSIANIPLQRNYRTNVYGELLTVDGSVNITIDQNFAQTDKYLTGDVTVDDIAAVNTKLAAGVVGDVKFVVTSEISSAVTIEIPENCLAETITVVCQNVTKEATITAEGDDFAGTVTIITPTNDESQLKQLTINTPLAHVEFLGYAAYANTITSPTTFVLLATAQIGTLTVEQGSVETQPYSTVETLAVAPATDDNADAKVVINGTVGSVESTDPNVEPEYTTGITIGDTEYLSLEAAVAAAVENDVIVLAEGIYTVSTDATSTSHDVDASYFLNITTPGLTIKAAEGAKVVIEGLPYENATGGGNWTKQNLVTVQAENVTLDGLTFVANYNAYYKGTNKTIEMYTGATGLTVKNCTFLKGTDSRFSAEDGGCLWLGNDKDAMTATIQNCTFEVAGITVRPNTTATISGCTFNEIRNGIWKCSLSNRGITTASNCTFNSAVTSERGVVNSMGQGVLNLTGCTFPASDIMPYILITENAVIVDNATETTYVGELATFQGGSGEATTANPYFALNNNTNIVNLNVTSESIGQATFSYCSNLSSAVINSKVIGMQSFRETSIKEVEFNGVEQISQEAFYKAHLTGDENGVLTLPSTLKGMGNQVFSGAYNDPTVHNSFKKVVIEGEITKVEQATFQTCWNLEEVVLPASVTFIEAWAFYGCGQLSDSKTLTVTMPSPKMVEIDNGVGNNIFKGLAASGNAAYKNDVSVTVKVPADLVEVYKADANWAALMADTTNTYSLKFVAM